MSLPDRVRSSSAKPGQRLDIQAMRTFAVLSVMAFHLFPGRVTGGYVGVDVFFVISGYLITSHLVRELSDTGRIRLGAFWARRAKRLLPGALLVLLATAVAIMAVAPLGARAGWLHEVVAASLYFENWALAAKSVDYLAMDDAASPVIHYWSLSVEEQFYVLVPILLAVVALLARSRPVARLRLMGGLLAVLVVASFAWSVIQTESNPAVAYFSTLARAWQFLAGGLLALAPKIHSARVAWLLSTLGLAGMSAGCFAYGAGTAFPGYAAVLPVVATVSAIAAADQGLFALAGRLRAVRWIGDHSYALYLWHWPAIALLPAIDARPLSPGEKVAIAVGTLVLAWLSTDFFENPIRQSPRLLGGYRPALAVGLACALGMSVVGGVAYAGQQSAETRMAARLAAVAATTEAAHDCISDAVLMGDPAGCPAVARSLVPPPAVVTSDDGNDRGEACWNYFAVTCPNGPPTGAKLRIIAVGDSHSNMYLPAYERWARLRGWSIDVTGAAGCWWGARAVTSVWAYGDKTCTSWRGLVTDMLDKRPPYDVILVSGRPGGPSADIRLPGETESQAITAGLVAAWKPQIARGAVVVPILDVPTFPDDLQTCIATHQSDPNAFCSMPRGKALPFPTSWSDAASDVKGAVAVDLARRLLCDDAMCHPVRGNVIAYFDGNHLSRTFADAIADELGDEVEAAAVEAKAELER